MEAGGEPGGGGGVESKPPYPEGPAAAWLKAKRRPSLLAVAGDSEDEHDRQRRGDDLERVGGQIQLRGRAEALGVIGIEA